ncbi:hypothetical protein [Rufibacter roseus]|uniref:2-dehydro-3-deoxyphosphooctonate aldolase n=1 Tax=Rufibacter roseus TaxID=1567108 RepID=A0ABW2DQA4_9BACT|nr:hypothetical protein [Rufibacter roseus]
MKKKLLLICLPFVIAACGSTKQVSSSKAAGPYVKQELYDQNTFRINSFSQDKTYGYEEKNPIKVGGAKQQEGPMNERRFLNALTGPNGEEISYYRIGSCCHFETPNGLMGGGLLDMYSVTYEGLAEPIKLYINMYDSDTLHVPTGFKLRY